MATKYNLPFVNINTFIYQPVGLEVPDVSFYVLYKMDVENAIKKDGQVRDFPLFFEQNTTGISVSNEWARFTNMEVFASQAESVAAARNFAFQDSISSVALTASWFHIVNMQRNGPYGYCTWKQIRAHETSLVRNQKKKNIFTAATTINVDNKPVNNIEVFIERPVSFEQRNFEMVVAEPLLNEAAAIRYKTDLTNRNVYFDNHRLNNLYTGYSFLSFPDTDSRFINEFLLDADKLINGRFLYKFKHTDQIYPPASSTQFKNRTRNNFSFPWHDDFTKRTGRHNTGIRPFTLGIENFGLEINDIEAVTHGSRWPLDIHQDYLINTSSRDTLDTQDGVSEENYDGISGNNAGILQKKTGYEHRARPTTGISEINLTNHTLPLYSYKHLISKLTSTVSPHGMTIEGVNNGTLYNDLTIDHLITGEAYWDAPKQYGAGPFESDYTTFVDDIKRKYRDHTIIPDFRSSLHFHELQNKPSETPEGFLSVAGGESHEEDNTNGQIAEFDRFGETNPGVLPQSSSIFKEFFDVYSHSDFVKNFDVAIKLASKENCFAQNIKLTCKGVKKFVPYDGFYPAQRTLELGELFTRAVFPETKTSASHATLGGFIPNSDVNTPVFFNNILQPMFGPGILYNSIKSGIAVDYPIHTSSLTLTNGGVSVFEGDYYIQKSFDHRIPFESLIEPSDHLTNLEFHCSNPHPSGNISGSVKYSGQGATEEYTLAMHNFLAETANFFLQDQNFSFVSSERSDLLSLGLDSGSIYGFNVRLFKTQNTPSEGSFTSAGNAADGIFTNSLVMTGSDVQETFTMYSNPQSFGPPSRITGAYGDSGGNPAIAEHTSSYSNLGYNWAFTPPYYDGISQATFLFNCNQTRTYSLEEIFNDGIIVENRLLGFDNTVGMDSAFRTINAGAMPLSTQDELGKILGLYNSAKSQTALSNLGHGHSKENCMLPMASLNINLGIIKDIDLLDDDTSDTVKVAVDISSQQKSQIIVQPKWEAPMFNFQHYSASNSVSLPLIGSQSAPRGLWHQYGAIEERPKVGVFMQIGTPAQNWFVKEQTDNLGIPLIDLADMIDLSKIPVKLGRTAQAKVIREAIVAVPFKDDSYSSTPPKIEQRRKFIEIERKEIEAALNNKVTKVDTSIVDMVEKMQRYVMPPMFNFVEDQTIQPKAMYIFEFSHTLDKEDLAAIWQNLPPKLMKSFEPQEVSVEHTLNVSQLLRSKKPKYKGIQLDLDKEQRDVDIVKEIQNNIKWLVFKVKQKAQQNYYDKVVGDQNKQLNKSSPYSYNWPYDYFSLVELAKIEADVSFRSTSIPSPFTPQPNQPPEPPEPLGLPENLLSAIKATTATIPVPNQTGIQTMGSSVFGNITIPVIPTTGSGGP